MGHGNRRKAIGIAGLGGLLMVAPVGLLRAQNAQAPFQPPLGPIRFSRMLERTLHDGRPLKITRHWQARFLPLGRGYMVEGQQSGVSVEAPSGLEPFADLERSRVEQALFPLTLDSAGQIMGGGKTNPADLVERAAQLAMARIGMSGVHPSGLADARRFLSTLQTSATEALAALPVDLFLPQQGEWEEARNVDLPDGGNGTVRVSFRSRLDQSGHCLAEAQREIITTIGQTSRKTSEMWQIEPLSSAG